MLVHLKVKKKPFLNVQDTAVPEEPMLPKRRNNEAKAFCKRQVLDPLRRPSRGLGIWFFFRL